MSHNKRRHRPPGTPGKPHYHRVDGQPGNAAGEKPAEGTPGEHPFQGAAQPGQPQQNRPRPQGQGPKPAQNRDNSQRRQDSPQQSRDFRNRRPDGNRQQQPGWKPQQNQNRDIRPEQRPLPPVRTLPPVEISDEIKEQLGMNGLEPSKKLMELEKEENICPICDKPIQGLIFALKHQPTGKFAHFDCIMGEIQKTKPDIQQKGRKLYYIGAGNFAIVREIFDKRGRLKNYTILERITHETKE
jgi:hypothetical protein